MVDRGATDTVMTVECLEGVSEIIEGAALKKGVQYEVANGYQIPNLGERQFLGITEEGGHRGVVAQICAVNKNLMCVSKIAKQGNRVVFDDDGSYVEDKASGEKTWMHNVDGMYVLKLWVSKKSSKAAGF